MGRNVNKNIPSRTEVVYVTKNYPHYIEVLLDAADLYLDIRRAS